MPTPTLPPAPPLDDRTYDAIVDQTTQLAKSFTANLPDPWVPPPDDPTTDPGAAMVRIFADMTAKLLTRLNQALEKNRVEFLSLIGTTQTPPQAARVPLTLLLVSGSDAEADVPAATPVAPSAGTAAEVFSTEQDLHLTRANLVEVLVREPAYDWVGNVTATATGASDQPFAVFSGGLTGVSYPKVDHSLYLSNDAVLAQAKTESWVISFGFTLLADAQTFLDDLKKNIEWTFSTTCGFQLLWSPNASSSSSDSDVSSSSGNSSSSSSSCCAQPQNWTVEFDLVQVSSSSSGGPGSSSSSAAPPTWACEVTVWNPPPLSPVPDNPNLTVNGAPAAWLCASYISGLPYKSTPPPDIDTLSARSQVVNDTPKAPDLAYFNGSLLDITKDFQPFGQRPVLSDAFYVAAADSLAKPNADIHMRFIVSDNVNATPTSTLLLRWEAYTPGGWTEVLNLVAIPIVTSSSSSSTAPSSSSSSSSSAPCVDPTFGMALSMDVHFTLPPDVIPTSVFTVENAWLRVRIISGDYGSEFSYNGKEWVATDFEAPSMASMTIDYTAHLAADLGNVGTALSCNDQRFETWQNGDPAYVVLADQYSSLYLGFDRIFTPSEEVSIYLELDTPGTGEVNFGDDSRSGSPPTPEIEWQYFNGDWAPLVAIDDTDGLSHSDTVTFVAPVDQQQTWEAGQLRSWIRACRTGTPFTEPRRLLRIVPNTVWAVNSVASVNEILGSSDGTPSQTFPFSLKPVLLGEVVQVNEPELTDDEQQRIRAAQGNDAVTLIAADKTAGVPAQIWVTWIEEPDFFGSGPTDRNYVVDRMNGTVTFGNGQSGLIPNAGSQNIRSTYSAGGGVSGNQPALAITTLKTTVPYVQGAINYEPASGGSDQESLDSAKVRGATILRNSGRAVAAQDYVDLTMGVSSAIARATAITPVFDPLEQYGTPGKDIAGDGQVVMIVVPWSTDPQPVPGFALLQQVADALSLVCPPAAELQVCGPNWRKVTVNTSLVAVQPELAHQVKLAALAAIEAYLHPLTGNDGNGWDFGVYPYYSQLFALLVAVPGVLEVISVDVKLDPEPPEDTPSPQQQRINSSLLIYSSGDHDVIVDGGSE